MITCVNCEGSGNIFGGVSPVRWAICWVCRGARTLPSFAAPETIRIHKLKMRKPRKHKSNPHG